MQDACRMAGKWGDTVQEGRESMRVEIKNRYNGSIIFSIETDNLKLAVEAAVKSYADLSGSNLRGSNLRDSNLRGSNLRGSDLSYSDLSGSNLRGSNLRDSNLRGSNLRGSDLSYSDLSGSNLRGSNIRYTKGFNKYLCTPLMIIADQVGIIRAYKLVNQYGEGPFNGGIKYEIGKEYTVSNADTNDTVQCAPGISLATLDWCITNWQEGYRILITEFTAADIAAIPIATDGKFRVHRCKIVGEKDLVEIGLAKENP